MGGLTRGEIVADTYAISEKTHSPRRGYLGAGSRYRVSLRNEYRWTRGPLPGSDRGVDRCRAWGEGFH